MGIPPELKYQSDGGPSLAQCLALLRDAVRASASDVVALLDAVIFNLLIGNHDAHGKNFSLLCRPDNTLRFSPLYDLISTVFYPDLTSKMAMKIGKQYKSALVFPRDADRFAENAGLGVAQVRARIAELAGRMLEEIPNIAKPHQTSEEIAALITERCEQYRQRFSGR